MGGGAAKAEEKEDGNSKLALNAGSIALGAIRKTEADLEENYLQDTANDLTQELFRAQEVWQCNNHDGRQDFVLFYTYINTGNRFSRVVEGDVRNLCCKLVLYLYCCLGGNIPSV